MIIIAAVIVSWLSGLWSCEAGRKDLTEEERLTIADYINSVSVLVQHSNKISVNFFTTLNKVKELPKAELETNLAQYIEESQVILENTQEINPPAGFEIANGYLKLVFDTRNRSYENYKPALFNVLDDVDFENSSTQLEQSFIFMYMSDEIYKYFQDELKSAGENLGIGNLTIIDSEILEKPELLDSENIGRMIADFKSVVNLTERRGVAVIAQSVVLNPQVLNEQDEYLIIKNGSQINITINVENQGNISENNVPVKATYTVQGVSKAEAKESTIELINPSEQKAVTFSGFKAYPGKKCELKIEAGPVENEVLMSNNIAVFKIMMEE
jgi:hypothetical protein